MTWSAVFLHGARRLVAKTTYLILGAGLCAGMLGLGVLYLLGRSVQNGGFLSSLLFVACAWILAVVIFVFASLATAAVADAASMRIGEILRTTRRRYGTFLLTAGLYLASLCLAIGVLVVLSLIGLGGSGAISLVVLVSPIVLVGGGLTAVLLMFLLRLGFAVVAVERCGATEAINRSWRLLRRRPAECILYFAEDAALIQGVATVVVGPVVVGAGLAGALQLWFLIAGASNDSSLGLDALGSFGLGGVLIALIGAVLVSSLLGGLAAFSVGTCVAFYELQRNPQRTSQDVPEHGFCDQCGARYTSESRFCDECGALVA